MGLLDLISHKYPFTDFHELNLDWCITAVLQLQKAFEDFSAGNKLIFADPLQHDLRKTYAKNTIVVDSVSGSAYLSLDAVPVGVQLDNTDYWLPVFDFAGYVTRANKNFTDHYYSGTTRTPVPLTVNDWVVLDDVLYKVTQAIPADGAFIIGTNIIHFTVEQFLKDFVSSVNTTLTNWYNQMTGTINQYKNDIDASELAYRNQLAQDIADTTASLQAQLDAAISGATVDSEVINARVGADGKTYNTLGDSIRYQFDHVVKKNFPDITGNEVIEGKQRGYIVTNSDTVDITDVQPTSGVDYIIVDCAAGDQFTINGKAGSTYYAWCFISSAATNNRLTYGGINTEVFDEVITAPLEATKLIIQNKNTDSSGNETFSYYGKVLKKRVSDLGDSVDSNIQLFNCYDPDSVISAFLGTGIEANANTRIAFIECEEDTEYSVSISSQQNTFMIATTEQLPANGVVYTLCPINTRYNVTVDSRDYRFIKTPVGAKYLIVYYYNAGYATATEEFLRTSILFNHGHVVFDYFPFYTTEVKNVMNNLATMSEPKFGGAISYTGYTLNVGWTGDIDTGFVHETGYDRPLVIKTTNLGTDLYKLEITVSSPDAPHTNGEFYVNVGGCDSGRMYEGSFTEHTYIRGFRTANSSNITISVPTTFDATITAVSLVPIASGRKPSVLCNGQSDLEGQQVYDSVYIGKDNAEKALSSANSNVAVGVNAMRDNLSGYWNVAIGKDALAENTLGSRNVAIGYITMQHNRNGHRNIAIGSFALLENTEGYHNIAIGADAMQRVTNGHDNLAMGVNALANITTASLNVGLGYDAFGSKTSGLHNTGVGVRAGTDNVSGNRNTFIGCDSGASTGIDDAIAIGYNVQATQSAQIVIGSDTHTDVIIAGKRIVFNLDGSVTWEAVT